MGSTGASPSTTNNTDDSSGSLPADNTLPSPSLLASISNHIVLDRTGKSHPFSSLYTGSHVPRRVLVIFVRHFFCGNCQEYLRSLSAAITPESLLRLPISTFIAVIGCGDPGLIDMYAEATGCPYPIYADPTRKLYDELGMVKTLALGTRPAYMKKGLFRSGVESVVQGLRQLGTGLVTKAGDQRQIGGEFLFEPLTVMTPGSPFSEGEKQLGSGGRSNDTSVGGQQQQTDTPQTGSMASLDGYADANREFEPKKVTWCHRMKTTRDHAEIPELLEVLGLDRLDRPPQRMDEVSEGNGGGGRKSKEKDDKHTRQRWSRALEERKGTGLSLAGQMSTMKMGAEDHVAPPPTLP